MASTDTGGQRPLYAVPLTLEGSSVLHQMLRFRRSEWRKLDAAGRARIAQEAVALLQPMESAGETAVFSLIGHKGDLMLVHYRESFDQLNQVELALANSALHDYLEQTTSFLSVVELGLYESSTKLFRSLADKGVEEFSPEWQAALEESMARQREAMRPRLYPRIPDTRYLCFYPMDRRRGEHKNWYSLPIEERARQMDEHGQVGRRYAGKVQQIISGSIGFDDWEWGVDLFAQEPLVFKKLIYEMRFDQVSAEYAGFGTFYVGLRCPVQALPQWLEGTLPEFKGQAPSRPGRPA